MTYRRRGFPEILERLLTSLVGGVAAERHPHPASDAEDGPGRLTLEAGEGAREVIGVWGRRNGASHRFREETDWVLSEDGRALLWQEKGELPDEGSVVEVTYRTPAADAPVDDLVPGGVARTLMETVGREVAELHARLEEVYRAGFVGTAEGKALGRVVELLGLERVEGGRPVGEVEFRRSEGSRGRIEIPAGTRVATEDGEHEYESTASTTLEDGQETVRVRVRDLEAGDPLPADSLTVISVPIAGVASVSQPSPTRSMARSESDEELRTRARSFLHGSERATPGALEQAVRRQGVDAEIREETGTPGVVEVVPRTESLSPEAYQRLLRAVRDVRPVGVEVRVEPPVPPVKLDLVLRLTTASSLPEEDVRRAVASVRSRVRELVERAGGRERISTSRLAGDVLAVEGVEDVRLVSAVRRDTGASTLDRDSESLVVDFGRVVLGGLEVVDPNLPSRLDVLVTFTSEVEPADAEAARSALRRAVGAVNRWNEPPSDGETAGRRIGYRELLLPLPLPGKDAGSLEDHLEGREAGQPSDLPDPSGLEGYGVRFTLTGTSGVSTVLSGGDDEYPLAPGERLTLAGVEVREEDSGGG